MTGTLQLSCCCALPQVNKLTRAMEEGRDARSKQAAKAWQSEDEEEEGGWPAGLWWGMCGVDVVQQLGRCCWVMVPQRVLDIVLSGITGLLWCGCGRWCSLPAAVPQCRTASMRRSLSTLLPQRLTSSAKRPKRSQQCLCPNAPRYNIHSISVPQCLPLCLAGDEEGSDDEGSGADYDSEESGELESGDEEEEGSEGSEDMPELVADDKKTK